MSRTGRWLVVGVVMVAAFGVSLWVCGALLLPLWLKSGADRWVVAAGLGVAVAALAALWGASWVGGQSEDSSSGPGERSISAGGDISGIASTGDGTTNIQQK
jgi:protein-S-isoprenylcysteine O-methyltransferase Ste14